MNTATHVVGARLFGARLFGARLAAALRDQQALIYCVLAYLLAVAAVLAGLGAGQPLALDLYPRSLAVLTGAFFVAFALGHTVTVMVFIRPRHLTRHIVADWRDGFLTGERIAAALPVFVLMPAFFSAYTSMKTTIPVIQPFSWDPAFARWDLWLHGGSHPWELLQPLLGQPLVSSAVNAVYNLWFFVLFGLLLWQAVSLRDRRLRMQFLVSFVVAWAILGSLAATLLSSAGPVYFGRVTGLEDSFAPLMAYLREAGASYPIWALEVQDMLWSDYRLADAGPGSGISAMPSMHVASSVLFALLGWRHSRLLGAALTIFALLILVGSVHLGWHYAIDGYAAVPAAWLVWAAVGRVLHGRRGHKRIA
jgi:hypothetical protein